MEAQKTQSDFLSDNINYDKDIAPYQFIKIYSGVGSGKNYFVDNLVRGGFFRHEDGTFVRPQYVLLVTSRRAKADEQRCSETVEYDARVGLLDDVASLYTYHDDDGLEKYENSRTVTLPDLGGLVSNTITLRSTACTNAQMETLWKEFLPDQSYSHPWLRFDMIVIDEVHSLISDASYQSAPFYVRRMIEETLKRSDKCKVIVMTGSPQILKDYPLLKDAHCIDLMESCRNLRPSSVSFITKEQANKKLLELGDSGQKVIYFTNRIGRVRELDRRLSGHIPGRVAMSYSDAEERSRLKKEHETDFNYMCKVEEMLKTELRLPDDCTLFLSTTRNKEGINIKNEDIRVMFTESVVDVDIQQMAGRLRNGMDHLYIVIDGSMPSNKEPEMAVPFCRDSDILQTIQRYYESIAEIDECCEIERFYKWEDDKAHAFIQYVHETFPYIRYDYATGSFMYYPEREMGRSYYQKQEEAVVGIKCDHFLKKISEKIFPGVPVSIEAPLLAIRQRKVNDYIEKHDLLEPDKIIRSHEKKRILNDLNEMLGEENKRLGSLLTRFGYKLETPGKRSNAPSKIVKIINSET